MLSIFHAIILGIVEGITEFLPISSTGHLILTSSLLGIPQSEFIKSFDIIIQLGAICAVLVLYWKKLLLNSKIFLRVLVAFIPTAVIGLVLYKIVKQYLLGSTQVVLWALLIGGIVLIIFEYFQKNKQAKISDVELITYKQAFCIGLFQSIAIIPGVSRSASTIVGGLLLGLSRATIVEFSFMLAVPTMAAATGLDLIQSAGTFHSSDFAVLAVGFVTAFIFALIAIKFLLKFVQSHTFIPFGVYRIALALGFFFLLV